ncbi:MAG: glycoside hydrolase family 3 C-terminal domain-containing protein [Bacteroidota bacterium]
MDAKIKNLIARLSLEEKASLCSGQDFWTTKPIQHLGIPEIWMSDGPHGLRKSPSRSGGGLGNSRPATCFPTASALSSSWNLELVERVGQAMGREARSQDVQIILGPGANIKRSPLGGRNFEYYSEDPILTGYMAAAFIKGVQSQGVGTSLKHFAVNNQEYQRMAVDVVVDERTLREIYLRGFEIAIKQANPTTIMSAYNKVNGIYCTEHPRLLHEILKKEWGYPGILISDWGANNDRVAGIKAGMHLEMPASGGATDREIVDAVRAGHLNEQRLDEIVAEYLQIIFQVSQPKEEKIAVKEKAHHALAKEAASESIVLLKNEHQVLPLDERAKVAVIGDFAQKPRYQGAGSSLVMPTQMDSAWEGMRALVDDRRLSFARGYDAESPEDIVDEMIQEAVTLARKAEVAVIFVGLPPRYESEGFDRDHMDLPPSHDALIRAVCEAQPQTVVVLSNGSAVSMPWVADVPAIIEGWLTGQATGSAVADILYGLTNPSGKLSETFPVRLKDTPAYINWPGEQRKVIYGEGQFIGYRYYDFKDVAPLFPFGHGLSYTEFAYADLKIEGEDILDGIRVTCKVKNVGDRAGKEVIQLYVRDHASPLLRPLQELKGFGKIALEPGQEETVFFTLKEEDLAYYDGWRQQWIAATGTFEFRVGASSRDIRLTVEVELRGTQDIPPMLDTFSPVRDVIAYPLGEETLRPFIEKFKSQRRADDDSPKTKSEREGEELMVTFMMDMPLIKFSAFTHGTFTHEAMYALLEKLNG